MQRSIVVALCGPHAQDGSVMWHRIDRAISVAKERHLTLFIAGDGNWGEDVKLFARRARESGVQTVEEVVGEDSASNTLEDVSRVVAKLCEAPYSDVRRLHLVTDDWHMPRAIVMLATRVKEVRNGLDTMEVVCQNVQEGPPPPRRIQYAESHGLADFLSGRYSRDRALDPHWGKPAVAVQPTFSI